MAKRLPLRTQQGRRRPRRRQRGVSHLTLSRQPLPEARTA